MSGAQSLFALCLSFISGIAIASFFSMSQQAMLVIFIVGIILAAVFKKRFFALISGLLLVVFGAGLWIHESAELAAEQNELVSYASRNANVSFRGIITQPAERVEWTARLVVQPENVAGKVLIFADNQVEYRYGDLFEVTGVLELPGVFEDFNYQNFLAVKGIYAVMKNPQIEFVTSGEYATIFSRLKGYILQVRLAFQETVRLNILPPEGALLGAMTLGDKSNISDDMKEQLNRAGVRHITAISGMHVSIVTIQLMALLIWLGLWRQQAFYITIALVVLFVVLTGLQPSAIRAGIMGGMFLLGQHIGRINVSIRALVFAATIMLAFNPLLLGGDVGFQLSFLAVLGIILFLPIFQHFTRGIPKDLRVARDLVGMTIAAQILTLPILIYNFGQISLVSVVGNILIVPVLPLVFAFGFIFLVGSTLLSSFFLSFPKLLSQFTDALLILLSRLRYVFWSMQSLSTLRTP